MYSLHFIEQELLPKSKHWELVYDGELISIFYNKEVAEAALELLNDSL